MSDLSCFTDFYLKFSQLSFPYLMEPGVNFINISESDVEMLLNQNIKMESEQINGGIDFLYRLIDRWINEWTDDLAVWNYGLMKDIHEWKGRHL